MVNKRKKGNLTEREAVEIYEQAGLHPVDRVGSTAGGRRMTDAFGHVDIIALGEDHVRFVQAKTNTGIGVRDFVEWAAATLPDFIVADFLVRHDGEPKGPASIPPRWRVQKPYVTDEVSYRTVVDERKDGVPTDGAGVVQWLQGDDD